jgi:NADP-reducing hydrogenase subunit HndC
MAQLKSPTDLENLRKSIKAKIDPKKPCISICAGSGCLALGCEKVIDAFKDEIKKQGLEDKVYLKETGCPGFCEKGTIVVIYPEEICYTQVKPTDVTEIISKTIVNNEVIDRLLYTDPATGKKVVHESEIPFYKYQTRLVIGNNIKIDPRKIEDYIALDGYAALAKACIR